MDKKIKQVKNSKKSVELEVNETSAVPRQRSENEKKIDLVVTFDAYFQGLMSGNPHILPHHLAPMRQFASSKGLKQGTKEEFDRVFRLY